MQIVVWNFKRRCSKRHLSQDGVQTLCGTSLAQFDRLTHRDFIEHDRVTCEKCGDALHRSEQFTALSRELVAA